MQIALLPEPELEFGGSGRHVDIRIGLTHYGPLDAGTATAPGTIRLGIVGTQETIEGVTTWLERCLDGIPAKDSSKPNLFVEFPGSHSDRVFYTSFATDSRLVRTISERDLSRLVAVTNYDTLVEEAVGLFMADMSYLAQNTQADVLICALPQRLLDRMDELQQNSSPHRGWGKMPNPRRTGQRPLNFHDLLKARAMPLRRPTQLIRPSTYDATKRRQQRRSGDRVRSLQDEATRAWNLHTALYYKAGGVPWRLVRESTDLATCHIGIRFYETLDRTSLRTSMAQVFNERGEGIIVRGGTAVPSKDDRQPHLDEEGAFRLLLTALDQYRQEHRTMPARVVLHKSSSYSSAELQGFEEAIRDRSIDVYDLLGLNNGRTRLFRHGAYPPLRGTFLSLDARHHVLYTHGSVDFYATYPGMYVPEPLELRIASAEQTPAFLAREVLELTKMNWNRTDFNGRLPITLHAAEHVGTLLKHVAENERVEPQYRYYM